MIKVFVLADIYMVQNLNSNMLEWLNSELVKNLTVATISLYGGVVGSNPIITVNHRI